MKELSIEQALEIQAEQVAEWQSILTDAACRKLEEWVYKQNEDVRTGYITDGYAVKRGMNIDEFVSGLAMQTHRENAKAHKAKGTSYE